MKTSEINIRDPFVFVYNGRYYLYGTGRRNGSNLKGFDVVTSTDLENWSEPKVLFEQNDAFWADRDYWAPEMHEYKGKFYLFASLKKDGRCRGTQIFVSDTPDGKFEPLTEYPVTPENWECLDGTLFIENGKPYIVFCHEWVQIGDGTICVQQLSDDLKETVGEPIQLLKASDFPSVGTLQKGCIKFVTDGPFFYRCENGRLLMLWSTFNNNFKYALTAAVSSDGTLFGKWEHIHPDIYNDDGGHGMIFRDLEGNLRLTFHSPNHGFETAVFHRIKDENGIISIVK